MFKNFLKDSLNFSFANIFIKALNIILIPIYVRLLSFEDYGVLELITTLTIIFVVVVSLELTQPILRFVADSSENEYDQAKYFNTGLQIIFITSLIFIVVCNLFASQISYILFKTNAYSEIIGITSLIISFQSINYTISVIYRSEKKFNHAIRHSIIVALLVGVFALSFLIISSGSLRSLLIGQAIGGFLAASFGIFILRHRLSFSHNFDIAKKMLFFSIPLVFSGIALHLSTFADRIIINEILSLKALAVYGIAAKASSIITILISGIGATLSPHFISTWNTSVGLNNLTKIFFIYLLTSVFLLIFLIIFGEYIILFLGTSAAIGGKKVLLILASASIINGLNIFLFGLIKAMKTSTLGLIYFSTAILNIYLNYLFIIKYGIEGAAFATLVSSSVGFLVHFYISSKHIKLPFAFAIPFCFIITILIFNAFIIYYV